MEIFLRILFFVALGALVFLVIRRLKAGVRSYKSHEIFSTIGLLLVLVIIGIILKGC